MSVSVTENKNKGGMIVLLIFLLVCAGLGIAAFVMAMTKCKKDGFSSCGGGGKVSSSYGGGHGGAGGAGGKVGSSYGGGHGVSGGHGGAVGGGKPAKVAIAMMDGCGHCKMMKDSHGGNFSKLKERLELLGLELLLLDAAKDRDIIQQSGVRGYPTIMLLDGDGNKLTELRNRDLEGMVAEVKQHLTQKEHFMKDDSGNEEVVFVMVLADWCGACKQFKSTGAVDEIKKLMGNMAHLLSDKDTKAMKDLGVTHFPYLCMAKHQNGKYTKLSDVNTRDPQKILEMYKKHAGK